jgi:uncharacterized protein (TIGR02466 family)
MAGIELWFPVAIYQENNLFSHSKNEEWAQIALDIQKNTKSGGDSWDGDTYTTMNTYNLLNDNNFSDLINSVSSHVHKFAKAHNSEGHYNCNEGWINVNKNNTFQEFHFHPNNSISAIYYISAPEGSGSLVFEDPKQPDMMPLKNIKERNALSQMVSEFKPQTGKLIIFRSYMRHLVSTGNNIEPRISVAFNFN